MVKNIIKTLNPEVNFRQKDGILKLANEMEDYIQMQMWGYNVVDIAHAVRRAQAINSDIKSWGLKYITQFNLNDKTKKYYDKLDEKEKHSDSAYTESEEFFDTFEAEGEQKGVEE